jgi:hypothetical protein
VPNIERVTQPTEWKQSSPARASVRVWLARVAAAAGVTALGSLMACNAAIGAGAVAVMGGAGYFAGQCYDTVRVHVIDAMTGHRTCDAEVRVTNADGSDRVLRPCYHVALTEGQWTLTARRAGYAPATTEVNVPERTGSCPRYTHSVEFTLMPESGQAARTARRSPGGDFTATERAPRTATELESPPSSASPAQRARLTRSFGEAPATGATRAPDAGAPR